MRSRETARSVSWLTAGLLLALGCSTEPTRAPTPSTEGRSGGWGGLEVTIRGNDAADCALVVLHGYGAPGDDLVSLGATAARATGCLAVMPAAHETAPNPGGRQWWALDDWRARRAAGEDLSGETPHGLEDASRRVHGVLDTLKARGIEPGRVVVAGFSQGAMLALDAGLTAARPVAGIAVLSGTLIARPRWSSALERHAAPPVLLTHGRGDPILSFARAEQLEALLREHEVAVELVPFDGGHTIPPRARERFVDFARRRLAH